MTTPDDDPVLHPHTGSYEFHDDDCRCTMALPYCNRGGWVWSCCGATKKHSDCSGAQTDPTYWSHPKCGATVDHWENHWPVHKSNAEIRAVAPECFEEDRRPRR